MMPFSSLLTVLLLAVNGVIPARRKTVSTAFCNRPHLLKTGEPVAHCCRVLPVEALEAEADGHALFAARIMAGKACVGPLMAHPGIWRTRRR
jgi:hypothetical protein